MSRYYDYMLIKFMDGSTERVGGNEISLHDGVLSVRTTRTYGPSSDVRHFPLANIKSYHWEEGV